MRKSDAKPMMIVIALHYGKTKMNPKKVRDFWSRYIQSLSMTGLSGIPEGEYISSGVSVYDGKEYHYGPSARV